MHKHPCVLQIIFGLIIDSFYAGMIRGKLDQRAEQLEVMHAVGRDTQPADLDRMIGKLERWEQGAAQVLSVIDDQIQQVQAAHASAKESSAAHQAEVRAAALALGSAGDDSAGGHAGMEFDDDPSSHSTRGKRRQQQQHFRALG